jgi:phosphoribosylglycinamide formyltransferase 1
MEDLQLILLEMFMLTASSFLTVIECESMTNVAVLASGRGSNFRALAEHQKLGIFDGVDISLLVYNHQDARVKETADKYGIPSRYVNLDGRSRVDAETEMLDLMKSYSIDLVCLAGWDKIVGSEFFNTYRWKLMNIHPSLHPAFAEKGLNAMNVHKAVLESGVYVTGCTVFYVDMSVYQGPIVLQEPVVVEERELFLQNPEKAVDSLSARVLVHEHRLYPKAIQLHSDKRLEVVKNKTIGNYVVTIGSSGDWGKNWNEKQKPFIDFQLENTRSLYGSLA